MLVDPAKTGAAKSGVVGQAKAIAGSVNNRLDAFEERIPLDKVSSAGKRVPGPVGVFFKIIDSIEEDEADKRIAALRRDNPRLDNRALAQKIIRERAKMTGAIGASTAAPSLLPGIGSLAAMTVGVTTDIVGTFRVQAEMITEIAHLYGHRLSKAERRNAVLAITGIGIGLDAAIAAMTRRVAVYYGREYAEKALVKAIPALGLLVSAGADAVSTYVIGQRALRYFAGEELGSLEADFAGLSPERQAAIRQWAATGQRKAGEAFEAARPHAANVARVAGEKLGGFAEAAKPVAVGAAQVAGSVLKSGASTVADGAQRVGGWVRRRRSGSDTEHTGEA